MAEKSDRDEAEADAEQAEAAERRRLRQRIEEQAAVVRARRQSGAAPLEDAELTSQLGALGFDERTAALLPYLPLIQVAWADGRVAQAERVRVFEALHAAKVPPGGPAWALCEALLEERPSELFLEETRRLLRLLLERQGTLVPSGGARAIVDLCMAVAQASGGIFGRFFRVSSEEEAAVAQVAQALGDEAVARFQELLRGA